MKTIFNLDAPGRHATRFNLEEKIMESTPPLPENLARDGKTLLGIPDVPEVELVRHFIALSRKNYGVDNGMYPLGSCTMKYNPKIHEMLASLEGFTSIHPYQFLQDKESCEGIIEIMNELASMLATLTGMDAFSLQPASGAHGEFTGLLIMRDYLLSTQEGNKLHKNKIIVPDTAHGTNPASAAVCQFEIIELESGDDGLIDLGYLEAALEPGDVAGIMLTNPNTLGLFEQDILRITEMVHDAGGLCYYDGANLNGLCGLCRPGDMGFDIVHLNLHKTFSTPHGGGGPGAGPLGVKAFLAGFLVGSQGMDGMGNCSFDPKLEVDSRNVKVFHGNIGVLIRAYCYLKSLGFEGMRKSTKFAVFNANYLKKRVGNILNIPYDARCYHEFVANDEGFPNGITTEDIAKRMLDHGIHAPTIYFPLIVHGAMMIEPTETEDLSRLDGFVHVMKSIKEEARDNPDMVKDAPSTTPVSRLDQVKAARHPVLTVDDLKEMVKDEK
ncbi:aminomethyl-transferring glycine dehydrogenase subunit GcvPB [Candidatus Bathyarchaeota archaeon]|nr:aminomethyl-transferring glycine dehydrogenase subunit GcvPB [Candidatus Bathyarchaeota archaeon]